MTRWRVQEADGDAEGEAGEGAKSLWSSDVKVGTAAARSTPEWPGLA
jgi:hypothetical protein